jgi:hypothetical protein
MVKSVSEGQEWIVTRPSGRGVVDFGKTCIAVRNLDLSEILDSAITIEMEINPHFRLFFIAPCSNCA